MTRKFLFVLSAYILQQNKLNVSFNRKNKREYFTNIASKIETKCTVNTTNSKETALYNNHIQLQNLLVSKKLYRSSTIPNVTAEEN